MRLSHPLLMLASAALVWALAGLSIRPPGTEAGGTAGNPLALHRSAFGSMTARLMKDSLHSYWHDGQQEKAGDHHDHDHGQGDDHDAPTPAAGKLRLLRPAPPAVDTDHANHSWLVEATEKIDALDEKRTARNSPFATSSAHRRFLNAAADSRLFQAYAFDPCDAALYEIAHYTALTRAPTMEAKRSATEKLANGTLAHALAPTSGLSEALTGAGAAINLFNDQLQPDRSPAPDPTRLQHDWQTLSQCLGRYRTLRQQADTEGWWQQIPEVRRGEIEAYAAMLEKLSQMVHEQLAAKKIVP